MRANHHLEAIRKGILTTITHYNRHSMFTTGLSIVFAMLTKTTLIFIVRDPNIVVPTQDSSVVVVRHMDTNNDELPSSNEEFLFQIRQLKNKVTNMEEETSGLRTGYAEYIATNEQLTEALANVKTSIQDHKTISEEKDSAIEVLRAEISELTKLHENKATTEQSK